MSKLEFTPQIRVIEVPGDVSNANISAYVNRTVTRTLADVPNLFGRSPARLETLTERLFVLHFQSSTGDNENATELRTTPAAAVDVARSGDSTGKQNAGATGHARPARSR